MYAPEGLRLLALSLRFRLLARGSTNERSSSPLVRKPECSEDAPQYLASTCLADLGVPSLLHLHVIEPHAGSRQLRENNGTWESFFEVAPPDGSVESDRTMGATGGFLSVSNIPVVISRPACPTSG